MSLFFELCRLCLVNCSSMGVIIYENDEVRRLKIKECLSIIIPDDRFQICSNCESKLDCFYQFRVDSIRCQHEFNEIIKSVPQQNIQYEHENIQYYPQMNDQNMYSSIYDHQPHTNEIQNGYYIDELHLSLEDDNHDQNDSHSLIPTNDQHIYQMQTPATEEIHHEEIEQPSQIIEQEVTEETSVIEPIEQPVEDIMANDDFSYDDFDESCQSFPNNDHNIDNVIDKKIEEFIQNKRNKANPKICTVCNKLFRTNYKLREHMQTHENNSKFICDLHECKKSFRSKIGLKEHVAREHTGEHNFICEICKKPFLLRSYYLAHQKIHSNVKNFTCTVCSKTFKNKHNLVNHENSHFGLKNFVCEICKKSFTTKSNLDVHIKQVHTEIIKHHECHLCKKFFKTAAYLKIHHKTHFKELQNYVCNICGKTFIQLCDLKIHSKTHTNQKDFVCEICGESFTRKDSLKLHVSSVHDKNFIFNCEGCQKMFTRKKSLNQHKKKCSAANSSNCESLK